MIFCWGALMEGLRLYPLNLMRLVLTKGNANLNALLCAALA